MGEIRNFFKKGLTMTKSVMLGEISVRALHGPWSDFMDKLQGDDGRLWFDGFKRFLRKEDPWHTSGPSTDFPVWRTVRLGKYETPDEYRRALGWKEETTGVSRSIHDSANFILNKITCSEGEDCLDLVLISQRDVRINDAVSYGQFCSKVLSLGYRLCPAEVGPALRLQYVDQPDGETVLIAMEAISDRIVERYIFSVENSGKLDLFAYYGHAGCTWGIDNRFAFVKPRF